MDTGYTFVNRADYFRALTTAVTGMGPGDRVVVAAMALDVRPEAIRELLQQLARAAARGVRVGLWVDAMSFMLDEYIVPGPLWLGLKPTTHSFGPFGARYAALAAIEEAGGSILITNVPSHPFSMPVAGRSHIKFAVVNNTTYIGGHNLNHPDQLDIMVCWESAQAAGYLCDLFEAVITANGNVGRALNATDTAIQLGASSTLLIDAGQKGRSAILDAALGAIDDAQEYIVFTCQYFPGGIVAKHLAAAEKRGVNVRILFSHPSAHRFEAGLHYAYNRVQRARLPRSLFAHQLPKSAPKLHAKLLATESTAILGSHNLVVQGVALGTAEIALVCHDSSFSRSAVAAIEQQIATLTR